MKCNSQIAGIAIICILVIPGIILTNVDGPKAIFFAGIACFACTALLMACGLVYLLWWIINDTCNKRPSDKQQKLPSI